MAWLSALCWVWCGGAIGFLFGASLARKHKAGPLYIECPRCKRARMMRILVDQ